MSKQPPIHRRTMLANIFGIGEAEEPDMLASVLLAYLDDTPDLVRHIQAAALQGNWRAVQRGAHAVKGSSRLIGAVELGLICAELEDGLRANRLADPLPLVHRMVAEFAAVEQAVHAEIDQARRHSPNS